MHHVVRAGLCALIVACALAGAPEAGVASDPSQLPAQGVYNWCAPARSPDGCAKRLHRIGDAGFRVIVNGTVFDDSSEEQIRAYAQEAAAAGVRVIWPLNRLWYKGFDPNGNYLLAAYPELAASCGCSDNKGLVVYLVGVLRGLPNTSGYYLADEPRADAHSALMDWVSRVKAVDPDHQRIVMGCGVCGDGPGANVPWLADLDIMLGTDAYPVFGGPPDPSHAYTSVAQNVATLDRVASAARRQQVVALQSWSWGDSAVDNAGRDPAATRFPTREEIQAQRDAAIENAHPDLILWFTLTQVIGWEPGQHAEGWSNPPDTERRWASLVGGAFAPPGLFSSAPMTSRAPTSTPHPNRALRAYFTLRGGARSRLGRGFTADGGRSRDFDGRIVRYVWTLNRRHLARCKSRRCAFRIGHGRVQRLALTVTDNRGARAVAQRKFSVTGRRAATRATTRHS